MTCALIIIDDFEFAFSRVQGAQNREREGDRVRGRENRSNFCIALSFRNYRGDTISQANLRAVACYSLDLVAGR